MLQRLAGADNWHWKNHLHREAFFFSFNLTYTHLGRNILPSPLPIFSLVQKQWQVEKDENLLSALFSIHSKYLIHQSFRKSTLKFIRKWRFNVIISHHFGSKQHMIDNSQNAEFWSKTDAKRTKYVKLNALRNSYIGFANVSILTFHIQLFRFYKTNEYNNQIFWFI